MARLVRIIIYEGDIEWIAGCRNRALPIGVNNNDTGFPIGKEKSITIIEPEKLTFKTHNDNDVDVIIERTKP